MPRDSWRLALLIALLLGPTQLHAENLLVNPGFDTHINGWSLHSSVSATHSDVDVASDPDSGSARVTNTRFGPASGAGVFQCRQVTSGTEYEIAGWAGIPSGQAGSGFPFLDLLFYSSTTCAPGTHLSPAFFAGGTQTTGRWHYLERRYIEAPSAARSARLSLVVSKDQAADELTIHFDDLRFCPAETCGLLSGPILSSGEIPDFVFQVSMEAGDQAFPGIQESSCLPETICVSGAIPGRTEAQLRVIGPRPNGYLWFQVVRFTPSRVVVAARQNSTGVVRFYVLEAVKPGKKPTNLEDRFAFLP